MPVAKFLKVVGHRGASLVAPENTGAAFVAARELGAHGVEFDVQQTADGQLVVVHDSTVDRTTNGTGEVKDMTWNAIRKLDANGSYVPALSEVLSLCGLEFELELKGFGAKFLDDVVGTVLAAGVFDLVEFTSGNLLLLSRLKRLVPSARVGLFAKRPDKGMSADAFERYIIGTAETSGFDVAHVYAGAISETIVEQIHLLGMTAHANDADNPELIRRAIDAGADRCTTIDVAMAVAETKISGVL